MRKLLPILPCLMLLCGFGSAPDPMAAVPKAQEARKLAFAQCRTQTELKPFAEALNCMLAADRDFAQAIDLRDSALVDSYAGKVQLLTADLNAGKLRPADASTRFAALETDFFKTANSEFAVHLRESQEFSRKSHMNLSTGEDGQADLQ